MRTKLLILLFAIPFFTTAQTGPGGIGKDDGSSGLKVWLRDTLQYKDAGTTLAGAGDPIYQWNDMSGNGNDAIQATSSKQPTAKATSFNTFSVPDFSNDDLTIALNISPSALPDITIIAVADHNTATTDHSKIFGHDNGGYDRAIGFDTRCGGETFDYYTGTGVECFVSPSANTQFVVSASYRTADFFGWYNGKEKITAAPVSNNDGKPELSVGNISAASSEYWDGAIAEFIVFKELLNPVQEIIVHNYLAAKYEIALLDNDIYDEDDPANGDHDYDVAGIGRTSDMDIHDDSRGTGIVEILNPSDLNDGEFLIWGHNNGDLSLTSPADQDGSDYPATVEGRWQRVWRVSERSQALTPVDVGKIDIRFDMTGLGAVNADDLKLLVDTDNDGVFADETPIGGATKISPNIYEFSQVVEIADNLRFTLATANTATTPLPVELTAFNVKATDKNVLIKWATASEINSDYFTVERSENGKQWQALTTVKAAGNSSGLLQYAFTDINPLNGLSYYRLKQTDFTGEIGYSDIKSIKFNEEQKTLTLFPNPANNLISIRGDVKEQSRIRVFSALGQEVTASVQWNSEEYLDISRLTTGWYFIKTDSGIGNFYKK